MRWNIFLHYILWIFQVPKLRGGGQIDMFATPLFLGGDCPPAPSPGSTPLSLKTHEYGKSYFSKSFLSSHSSSFVSVYVCASQASPRQEKAECDQFVTDGYFPKLPSLKAVKHADTRHYFNSHPRLVITSGQSWCPIYYDCPKKYLQSEFSTITFEIVN